MKNTMRISAVVAMSENHVIGKGQALPWKIPEDLKRFRSITQGHPIILGRKTFESIGKVLPDRENIILSRRRDFCVSGAVVLSSLDEALKYCVGKTDEAFVIGGAEIYRQALPILDRIYLTLIHQDFEGDAYFPEFPWSDFREVSREERLEPVPFSFLVLERNC